MDTTDITQTTNDTVNTVVSQISASAPITLLVGLVILICGFVGVRVVMKRVTALLKKNDKLKSVQAMMRSVIHFTLDLIVVIIAASYIGIPMTSVLAVFSIIGLAVSLAIQGLLTNLTAGLIILISRPFEVGDFIETNSLTGTVMEIRMLHTTLNTPDGRQVFMPNNVLYSSSLINYNATGLRRIDLPISASYDNSPAEVKTAIRAAIQKTPGILQEPAPDIHLDSYGDSAINYSIWLWVKCPDYLSVKFTLNENLYQAFADNHVVMTYPHLNVHMQS